MREKCLYRFSCIPTLFDQRTKEWTEAKREGEGEGEGQGEGEGEGEDGSTPTEQPSRPCSQRRNRTPWATALKNDKLNLMTISVQIL